MSDGLEPPRLSEQQSPLITHQIEDDETTYVAITEAFEAIGIDVYDQETTIEDWTQKCPISQSMFDSNGLCRLSTVIWGRPTVITSSEIRIYKDS